MTPEPIPTEAATGLDHQHIELLAYSFWEERNADRLDGSDVEDWLRAEAMLRGA